MRNSLSCSVFAFALLSLVLLSLTITRLASSSSQPGRTEPAVAAAAELSVDQVLERYTTAVGGREAIDKIKSRSIKGSNEYTGSIERATSSMETYWKTPDKSLEVLRAPFGDIKRGFNGTRGWAVHPQNSSRVQILGEDETSSIRREMILFRPFTIKAIYPKLAVEGRKGIDGHNALIIAGDLGNGRSDKLYFDAATYLLFRLELGLGGTEGARSPEWILSFDDYRQVDGMQFPFTTRLQRQNSYTLIKFSEIKHNVAIEDSVFDPPASPQK